MKKLINMVFAIAAIAFTGKVQAQENFKWAEMNNFHATAMSCFHAAEANKLQPARDSAASILLKAQAWQSSPLPAGYDAAVVKPLLQRLVEECKSIKDAVDAKKPDGNLRPLVMKAHNTFHEFLRKTK